MEEEKKNETDNKILTELEDEANKTLNELVSVRFKIIELKKREHDILASHFETHVGEGKTVDVLGEFNKHRKNLLFLMTDLRKLKEKIDKIEKRVEEKWGSNDPKEEGGD